MGLHSHSEKLRIHVAVSNDAEPEREREIGLAEALIDEKRPRLYRNVKTMLLSILNVFRRER